MMRIPPTTDTGHPHDGLINEVYSTYAQGKLQAEQIAAGVGEYERFSDEHRGTLAREVREQTASKIARQLEHLKKVVTGNRDTLDMMVQNREREARFAKLQQVPTSVLEVELASVPSVIARFRTLGEFRQYYQAETDPAVRLAIQKTAPALIEQKWAREIDTAGFIKQLDQDRQQEQETPELALARETRANYEWVINRTNGLLRRFDPPSVMKPGAELIETGQQQPAPTTLFG